MIERLFDTAWQGFEIHGGDPHSPQGGGKSDPGYNVRYLPVVAAIVLMLSGCTGSISVTDDPSISDDEFTEEGRHSHAECAEVQETREASPQPEVAETRGSSPKSNVEDNSLVLDSTYADHPWSIDYVGRAVVRGVLQIYWRTDWPDSDSDTAEKSLRMRFFLAEGEAQRLPEIHCEDYDRTPSILQFYTDRDPETGEFDFSDNGDQAAMIVEDFEVVPPNFFRYREGHVEQPGTLVLRELASVIECDAPYTFVRLEAFEPSSINGEHRELVAQIRAQDRSSGGCGTKAPYEESFMLADRQVIYAEADLDSPVLETPSMPVVIKIRTVDDDWIEVYSYSNPDIRGFVRSERLSPVN